MTIASLENKVNQLCISSRLFDKTSIVIFLDTVTELKDTKKLKLITDIDEENYYRLELHDDCSGSIPFEIVESNDILDIRDKITNLS